MNTELQDYFNGLCCTEPVEPLNKWIYSPGQAPSLEDFELIVGFSLINGVKTGDTITFDNIGYSLPQSAFTESNTLEILTQAISAEDASFKNNTGLITANALTTITTGQNCFGNNSGTIIADNLVDISLSEETFKNNSGTISIKSLTPIGDDETDNGQMGSATSTAIFNVNIANQTNNSGDPDGDVQSAIDNGATINYF